MMPLLPRRDTARATVRTRRLARVVPALGLAALLGSLAACADAPSAPAAAAPAAFTPGPHRDLLTTLTTLTSVGALTWSTPLAKDVTYQTTVTPSGGTIAVPSAGLTVTFPDQFVSKPTTFWVTVKAGSVVAFDFGPSGTFTKPVTIQLRLQGTNWLQAISPTQLQGAYVQSWLQLNPTAALALVNELLPSNVDVAASTLTFNVWHFRGYMVSTGRSSAGY
jgi:hypothetical protein